MQHCVVMGKANIYIDIILLPFVKLLRIEYYLCYVLQAETEICYFIGFRVNF